MSRYLSPRLIQEIYDVKKTTAHRLLKEFRESGGTIYKIGRLTRVYDEEFDDYFCEIDMDMDDMERLHSFSKWECPYFQFKDEYRIVRKQN